MEKPGEPRGLWNVFPLRVVYRSGDKTVSLGLNGLSFLVRSGVSIGKPVVVDKPRRADVISVGGRVIIDSSVDGDVWALGADVDLRQRAEVSGNVVAIGGKVTAAPRAVVKGSVSQLPELKVPFLGMLGTQFSALSVQLGRELLAFLLFAAGLFVATFYFRIHVRGVFTSLQTEWRMCLVTAVLAIAVAPLLAVFLIASIVGVFLLPALILVLAFASIDGLLVLCSRLGAWMRRGGGQPGAHGDSLYLFTSGLLGLFLLKAPAFVGIAMGAVTLEAVARVGEVLRTISLALTAIGLFYGFGAILAHVRARQAGPVK
jgi:hypothetical protein